MVPPKRSIEATHRPLDLRMAGVADQDDITPIAGITLHFHVDFGDERTCCIEYRSPRVFASARGTGHAVRRENDRRRSTALRSTPRRTPRPARAAGRPHVGCARPRAGHRSARRTTRSRARRYRSHDRRRHRSRGDWREELPSNTHLLRAPALPPGIQEQQNRPDGDGRIRDVECREIIFVAPVRQNEIDDVTDPQPVDHIAQRAAQDQRQTAAQQPLRARSQAPQPAENGHSRRPSARPANSQRCQPEALARKLKAAPVLYIKRDIQYRQHVHTLVHAEVLHDPGLRDLIDHDHDQRERQPAPAVRLARHAGDDLPSPGTLSLSRRVAHANFRCSPGPSTL